MVGRKVKEISGDGTGLTGDGRRGEDPAGRVAI